MPPRLSGSLGLGLLVLATAACRPAEPNETTVDLAALQAPRHPAFDRERWLQPTSVYRSEFSGPDDLEDWLLGDWEGDWRPLGEAPHSSAANGGLVLAEPEARYWLMRELAPPERSARKLRVETDGNRAGDLFTACWLWEGHRRDWTCEPITLSEDGRFETEVEFKPFEDAAVESVKFQLTTARGRRVRLRTVELSAAVPARGAIDPGPWRVTLGGETRPAFAAWARDGRLGALPRRYSALSFGVSPDVLGGVTFEVVARHRRRERVLARYRIDPGRQEGGADHWHDLALRVDGAAGAADEQLDLTFRADRRGNEKRGFVFWSAADPTPRRPERRLDFLLVSLDTVRADRMSLYGYRRPTTPRLDAWSARHGVVFERAIAPAPWTLPSHASVFTGLDADRHGANLEGPLHSGLPVLAELLRRSGYETRATALGPVLAPEFGLDRGFTRFRVRGSAGLETGPRELDTGIADVLEWLREGRERDDFIFLHTYQAHDPHTPEQPGFAQLGGTIDDERSYVAPGVPTRDELGRTELSWALISPTNLAGRTLASATDKRLLGDLYDSGLMRLDEKLAQLLEQLASEGLAENLVVILFSDHGESLLERGMAGHHHLYEENLHVPLILAAPGLLRPGARIATPVSLVDIFPTVLELAGVQSPPGIDGISLAGALRGLEPPGRPVWSYAASSNRGFAVRRDASEKLLLVSSLWAAGSPRGQRLLLADDPGEERPEPLAPEQLSEMEREVARRIAALPSAVRVELSNRSRRTFELVLRGRGAYPSGVESLSAPAACCAFSRRWLRARIPPGRSYELALVDRRAPELAIQIGQFRDLAFPNPAAAEASFEFDGNSWSRAAEGGRPARAAVRLVRERVSGQGSASGAEEARARLRALGYVE